MTPSQKAGLVVGRKYLILESGRETHANDLKIGQVFTFDEDDESDFPFFRDDKGNWRCWFADSVKAVEEPVKFKKGDIIKLVDPTGRGEDIDMVTSYTVTADQYGPVVQFNDNVGYGRSRPARDYTLVSRSGEEVASVAKPEPVELTVKIDASDIESLPAVKLERFGDKVELGIIGKLTKEQVESVLNIVFGS